MKNIVILGDVAGKDSASPVASFRPIAPGAPETEISISKFLRGVTKVTRDAGVAQTLRKSCFL